MCWRRSIFGLIALTVLLPAVAPAAWAQQQKRVALVIGNGAYAKVGRLENPGRDVAAIEAMLRTAGFDAVTAKRDLGRDAMRRALRDFSDEARGADIALVFFAGHGIEVNGTNYLIPVDAALERDIDVEDETVPLERVSQVLAQAKRLQLVILDACRDNPFLRSMRRTVQARSIGRGLARVEVTTSDTVIAFAARPGSTAADGKGANSPYTSALVKHLATPGLDVRLALGRVRDEVLKSTGNRQEPNYYGSLGGAEIALVPAATAVVRPDPTPPPGPAHDTVRVCREVEGMSSRTMLGVLARQYAGSPAADCIAARLAELDRADAAQAAEAARRKAAEEAKANAEAERICANVQSISNAALLRAMAGQHRGARAAACIAARIEALSAVAGSSTAESTLVIELKTGKVLIRLRPDLAPEHVQRVKVLASQGFYNGLKFHRVIDGFMAQTGDPRGDGTGGSSLPDLPAEFKASVPFKRGSVGAARTSNPNSANSQFFICYDRCGPLTGQYTLWGEVIAGMEHVDRLARGEPPREPDVMWKVYLLADRAK